MPSAPLLAAAVRGDSDTVLQLLASGAAVDAANEQGVTHFWQQSSTGTPASCQCCGQQGHLPLCGTLQAAPPFI